MTGRTILAVTAAALTLCAAQAAHADCKLQQLASYPISFVNNQPMVDVTINGKLAHLRFNIGYQTVFWGTVLKDYGLKETVGYTVGWVTGPGGSTETTATVVSELKMGDVVQKDAYVGVAYKLVKPGEAGIFGTDLFNKFNDVELDFAHNVVRVLKADGCKDDDVVYWGGNYSVIEESRSGYLPMKLAGTTLRGYIGAGNEVTFVTLEGAQRVGVTPQAAGPLPMGMLAEGVVKPIDVSIANFPELVIGDETIKNAPLAIGDIYPGSRGDFDPEIVLGADFLRSHRVYISRQQKKVYFSYLGGNLFEDIYARLGAPDPRKTAKAKPLQ